MAEMTSNVTPWSEDSMKNYQWLDKYLQKQPATEKEFQLAWQAYKYLLCGKMYACAAGCTRRYSVCFL